jgi:predicted nucleic acid-binding protein
MLVIDASALAELLLGLRLAGRVERYIDEHREELHAPHLLDLEVLSFLRRVASSGSLSAVQAASAVSDLLSLPIQRYPHAILGARIWELRENFSPYDAVYLALAEQLADDGVPLLTSDPRFARAARKHTGVEVLLAA